MTIAEDFVDTVNRAMQILVRVGGDGSIAEQLASPDMLARVGGADPALLRRVAALYAEAAEAARLARQEAAPLFDVLLE